MTASDETPGPGAPKKAARTAKTPAKKQAATKKATPRQGGRQEGGNPRRSRRGGEGDPGPAPGGTAATKTAPRRGRPPSTSTTW